MNKLRKNTILRTGALGLACIFLAIGLISGCINDRHNPANPNKVDTVIGKRDSSLRQVVVNPDTIKKEQQDIPPVISEEAMQKAVIYRRDSSFHVFNNIRADYRIIGYASPDTNSKKMILFSVFTSDVENNPIRCPYGSYYDSAQGDKLFMKYVGKHKSFIEVIVSWMQKKPEKIYFQNKWVEFDN